jgi:vancomycin resistance protein YoaR
VCGVAATLGFELAVRDRVMPGVSVLGVGVGGLTLDEAAAALTPRTSGLLDQQVSLALGDQTWPTSARTLGLDLDPRDLAGAAFRVGRDGPLQQQATEQLRALRSGTDLPVSRTTQAPELDAILARIGTQIDTPAVDAKLELTDGAITYIESKEGVRVDQSASRAGVAEALSAGQPTARVVTQPVLPKVTTAQVSSAREQLARILNSEARVTVTAADQSTVLDRGRLVDMLAVNAPEGSAGTASISLDDEQIDEVVKAQADKVRQDPLDARFAYTNGQLSPLRSSKPGRAMDEAAAATLLKTQILAGARTVDLPVAVAQPAVTTEDTAKLGITELIEESSTSFVGSVPEKAKNIALAAERLNGVVVPPGATFSFNKEVGPTTLESGYQWGFGLTTGGSGGVHTVPSVAGGICQVATTLFQPVFWAGYQLEERYWHLYWIPSYTSKNTVGLDATVDGDAGLDFKWINPTQDYVLIQSSTTADRVTFRLYGKKPAWTVKVEEPQITNRVAPDTTPEVQEEPLLAWGRVVPVETARDGFQVQLVRHVVPNNGGAPRDLVLKSIYQPAHNVTLVGTGNAPGRGSITAAVDRVRGTQAAAVQPAPATTTAAAAAPAPRPSATTYQTPNGNRTLVQIRDELRRAGWGGGSDQDALETYTKVSGAAHAVGATGD